MKTLNTIFVQMKKNYVASILVLLKVFFGFGKNWVWVQNFREGFNNFRTKFIKKRGKAINFRPKFYKKREELNKIHPNFYNFRNDFDRIREDFIKKRTIFNINCPFFYRNCPFFLASIFNILNKQINFFKYI